MPGGPPVIIRVRFFNKSDKPVSNLNVNVKGKAPDANANAYAPGMTNQDVPAYTTRDFLKKPPLANPLTSAATRFVEVSYRWGTGGTAANRHVYFDIDSSTNHTDLDRVQELHIDLRRSGENIEVVYTCYCTPDSTIPTVSCVAYTEIYPAS